MGHQELSERESHPYQGGRNVDTATAVEVGRRFSASWLVFYEKWPSDKYPRIPSAVVQRAVGCGHRMVVR